MSLHKNFDRLEEITNRAVFLLSRLTEIPPDLIADINVLELVEDAEVVIADWVDFQAEVLGRVVDESFTPDYRLPPGELIADYAEGEGWTLEELYDKLGFEREYTRQLLEGDAAVDDTAAERLSEVFGNSKDFWLNLENDYWNWKIQEKERQ
jgi:plasmid maintenance system antidote protein VapI